MPKVNKISKPVSTKGTLSKDLRSLGPPKPPRERRRRNANQDAITELPKDLLSLVKDMLQGDRTAKGLAKQIDVSTEQKENIDDGKKLDEFIDKNPKLLERLEVEPSISPKTGKPI